MDMRAKREYLTLGTIGIIFLCFLGYSLLFSRTHIRDDLRKQDVTNLKRAVEQYNNATTYYPTPPDKQIGCTNSTDSNSWFFGSNSPLLDEMVIDAIPHDVREHEGYVYSYCVTRLENGVTKDFYIQAQLEIPAEDIRAFDEDELRKFDYRIVNENGMTLYRVCGGDELQCKEE